ncbi:SDR family oxidoreductase [Mycolicibacterium mucogenicum]|uniref:SDR family oxidoreductase n=1 Tax=Mycolicibacterium mucogenicum TaxID=56689 RepID=UPI002269826E|nr:SDR family oxidoreductase [Mycolicibacterium mucogenicum]MCX8564411.1 SDR family oxidoreductase [Mycolicibacterium mucogenicum]
MADADTNRVALVTGGSRGIGAAIAVRLAAEGADVALTYASNPERATETLSQIKGFGRRGLLIQADQADPAQAAAAVDRVVDHFGRLDILVNNAGVWATGAIDDPDRDQVAFDRLLAVNLVGVVATVRAAALVMADGGRIISIATAGAAATRTPVAGLGDYFATKAAVAAYSKGWARDLGPRGITVNVVQPGPIESDMVPAGSELATDMAALTVLGRIGQPSNVAAAVAFLARVESDYITGTALTVDGGLQTV